MSKRTNKSNHHNKQMHIQVNNTASTSCKPAARAVPAERHNTHLL